MKKGGKEERKTSRAEAAWIKPNQDLRYRVNDAPIDAPFGIAALLTDEHGHTTNPVEKLTLAKKQGSLKTTGLVERLKEAAIGSLEAERWRSLAPLLTLPGVEAGSTGMATRSFVAAPVAGVRLIAASIPAGGGGGQDEARALNESQLVFRYLPSADRWFCVHGTPPSGFSGVVTGSDGIVTEEGLLHERFVMLVNFLRRPPIYPSSSKPETQSATENKNYKLKICAADVEGRPFALLPPTARKRVTIGPPLPKMPSAVVLPATSPKTATSATLATGNMGYSFQFPPSCLKK